MSSQAQKKALAKLNQAIIQLPEFKALEKLLGHNEAIAAVTVFEQDVKVQATPNVSYEGLTSPTKKGEERPYIIECCGEEYFKSNKSVEELSKEIQEAVDKAPKGKGKGDWERPFSISTYLREKLGWEKNDEVYPHMRMEAVGVFKVVL
jgi:hypothetical protein